MEREAAEARRAEEERWVQERIEVDNARITAAVAAAAEKEEEEEAARRATADMVSSCVGTKYQKKSHLVQNLRYRRFRIYS